MKITAFIIGMVLSLFGLSNCAGGKDALLEKSPPFKIENAFFQKWVAGVKGGGSGINFSITLTDIQEEVKVKEIYFRDRVSEAIQDPQNVDHYSAHFLDEINKYVIMDGNSIKEAANTLPEKIPFTLNPNDAVIGYLHRGELKYFKIENLEEKPILAYPSNNPNGID